MKHALVTGSRGFVGRHMVRELEDMNWQVTGMDLETGGDVFKHIWSMTKRYDLVVHAAAQAPNRAGIDHTPGAFPYNVGLDAVMMNWAIVTGQKRFVYLSSCAAYPARSQRHEVLRRWAGANYTDVRQHESLIDMNFHIDAPFDVYGWTKLTGERMAQRLSQAGCTVHVVRPFSGYGEDQSIQFPMRAFAERAKRREDPFIIWGNADQVRDWIHIDDIVYGILAIVDAGYEEPVNLCTGTGVNMRELALALCEAIGYTPKIEVDENAPMGAFFRVGNPDRFFSLYTPRVTLNEGVRRMMA